MMRVVTLQDLYYLHLVVATIKHAVLEAQQNRDPVTGAESELWLRSSEGAKFLNAAGYDQAYVVRQLRLDDPNDISSVGLDNEWAATVGAGG